MTPIQQLMLGAGKKVDPVYIDNVFSTYLYSGSSASTSGSGQTINNSIDLAGQGGLVWVKCRDETSEQVLTDTVNGGGKLLQSDSNSPLATDTESVSGFTSSGFTLPSGWNPRVNKANTDYASWSFCKAPGFFDVVTYTGTGSAKTESHSLGSVPGMILIKNLSTAGENWRCYHRSMGATKNQNFNLNAAFYTSSNDYNNTEPTSSVFSVGNDDGVNKNGDNYVAYIFAGGEDQTTATAKSVEFDGTGDYLNTSSSSSDFTMGTGDFTIEGWAIYTDDANRGLFYISGEQGGLATNVNGVIGMGHNSSSSNRFQIFAKNSSSNYFDYVMDIGQWFHFAVVRASGVLKVYINGLEKFSTSDTTNYNGTYIAVGGYYTSGYLMKGNISNFRVVKGTAVYTSSFRPPTEPLANITNTKLLCCNDSSTTGSTVTPVTLNSQGDPTASIDSPFDDPSGFVFGESGSENVIKTGSYVGNGSTTGPEVYVGWEPQWVLIKNASASQGWRLFDSMRGMPTGGNDARLFPSDPDAESAAADYIDLTSTGFKLKDNGAAENGNGNTLIYVAIRRSDGYVGKPYGAGEGTSVFSMDAGNSSSTEAFTSGFPIDFAFERNPTASTQWETGARLIQGEIQKVNLADADVAWANFSFDSNTGWLSHSAYGSSYQSWMWKRHAGFDVVTYTGTASNRNISHSLNQIPEMIWVKSRTNSYNWAAYHKGLNGGTNPEQYYLTLNTSAAEAQHGAFWNNTAPNSSTFRLGVIAEVNGNNSNYIAMLFASVDGISKVGYYDGSSSNVPVTTGFTPRFILIKKVSNSSSWAVFDTVRGLGSGNDQYLRLESSAVQYAYEYLSISNTGFTAIENDWRNNGDKYIYYAHA